MPTNDFIGFASAGSANIMSQADYAAAAEQTDGVQPGPASSALANKIWRQGSNMASAIGGYITDQGFDALDNGDIASLQSNLKSALCASGTWMPVFQNGAITATFTIKNYIKIGQFVYIIAAGNFTSNGSGGVYFKGLPYAISDNNSIAGKIFVSGTVLCYPTANSTGVYFTKSDASGNLQGSAVNGLSFNIALTYITAA